MVAPKLNSMTFDDLLKHMAKEARSSIPGWNIPEGDPSTWPNTDPGLALLKIFAHMHMEVISRLNRVPDKNFAAFLDMLGMSLRPARPARVPVTFYPVEGFTDPIFVAAGTPLATSETEAHPVLTYQTSKNFSACDSPIVGICSIDPDDDIIYDHLPDLMAQRPFQPFCGDNLQEHTLYLGHSELFKVGGSTDIKLRFKFATSPDPDKMGHLIWEYTNEDGKIEKITTSTLPVDSDNLQAIVTLSGICGIKETEEKGISSLWISCRKNNGSLPDIKAINIVGLDFSTRTVGPDYAYYNFIPINLKFKDKTPLEFQYSIYPFGMTPRSFDSFYIANREVFSKAGAEVIIDLTFDINNKRQPYNATPDDNVDPKLTWEYFNGKIWKILSPIIGSDPDAINFKNNGKIKFNLPSDILECEVYGVQNCWIRATITGGDYGREVVTKSGESYTMKSNFFPPCLSSVTIALSDSNISESNSKPLEHCLAYNNLQYVDLTKRAKEDDATGFKPFAALSEICSKRALFLGFENPFLEGNISLFFYVDESLKPSINPSLTWSYWGGDVRLVEDPGTENNKTKLRLQSSEEFVPQKELMIQEAIVDSSTGATTVMSENALIGSLLGDGWLVLDRLLNPAYTKNAQVTRRIHLQCQDNTEYLTKAETLDFIASGDQKNTTLLGNAGYWLMGSLDNAGELPPLLGVYPNTVWAEQVETVTDEVLGSSDGGKDMTFSLQNKPVVSCDIWVREGIIFSEVEKEEHKKDLSILEVTDDSGSTVDTWVQWVEVDDLFESDSGSRHYALDHALGLITFGDGMMGKIPPIGTDNIKAKYTWGGGSAGNVSSGEINTVKESLAGIDRVTNCQPAQGGSDTEAISSALERGPHLIKHRNRAVTLEDYERLAKEASSFIARTKCFTKACTPGSLFLIVIPWGSEDRPTPSQGLMDLVKSYLLERSSCAVSPGSLTILPPTYREIRIGADVYPTSIDLAVPLRRTVIEGLNRYFHPLTGGPNGTGWEFGRSIYLSDLYAMLEGISGVDHVENLKVNEKASDFTINQESWEIPCTGIHDIKIVIGA
jgi:hypothetical protein